MAGTEPVQRPGGEELREVRAGVEVWGAGCERRCRLGRLHCVSWRATAGFLTGREAVLSLL